MRYGISTITVEELTIPGDEKALGIGVIVFVAVIALFFVFVITMMVVTMRRRYKAAKNAGLDPFAGDIELLAQVKNSALLAPEPNLVEKPLPERLAAVDELYRAGIITAQERDATRARLIDSAL